jgi:hypothetical protein
MPAVICTPSRAVKPGATPQNFHFWGSRRPRLGTDRINRVNLWRTGARPCAIRPVMNQDALEERVRPPLISRCEKDSATGLEAWLGAIDGLDLALLVDRRTMAWAGGST